MEQETQLVSPTQYQWSGDAKFSLTGMQVDFIMKATNHFLSSEKSKEVLTMLQLNTIMEQLIQTGIKEGIVTPQESEEKRKIPSQEI